MFASVFCGGMYVTKYCQGCINLCKQLQQNIKGKIMPIPLNVSNGIDTYSPSEKQSSVLGTSLLWLSQLMSKPKTGEEVWYGCLS